MDEVIKILEEVKPGVDYRAEKNLFEGHILASLEIIMLVQRRIEARIPVRPALALRVVEEAGIERLADTVPTMHRRREEESDGPVRSVPGTGLDGYLLGIAAFGIPADFRPDSGKLDDQAVIDQQLQGFPDRTPVDIVLLPDLSLGGEQLAILVRSGDYFCFDRVIHDLVQQFRMCHGITNLSSENLSRNWS